MEAQSQGLACLSTRFSAIPELILEGRTGRLVAPSDPAALAEALAGLIAAPAERERLGRAGAERVRSAFDFQANVARLVERLAAPGDAGRPAAAAQ
jgi:glycosyltransferase involved in cell wall biosynthesis